jgi:isochorismate synthase EntC
VKKDASRRYYRHNPLPYKQRSIAVYKQNPQKGKLHSAIRYAANPENRKLHSKVQYATNPEKGKLHSKNQYAADTESAKLYSARRYTANVQIAKDYVKLSYYRDRHKKRRQMRLYYLRNGKLYKRNRYALKEPGFALRQLFIERLHASISSDNSAVVQIVKSFQKNLPQTKMSKVVMSTATTIALKRLMNRILQLRRSAVGKLMKAIRSILNVTVGVSTREGFGECMHTSHSEPYFYEAATHVKCGTDVQSSSEDHASLCSG